MTRPEGLSYQTANSDDALYGGADRIVAKEFEYISGWRGTEARAGVALSGGGIRSASFGLGVLQALAKGEWLQEFDYLSTVSGGGYTGASLSYLLHLARTTPAGAVPAFDVSCDNFPYLSYPMVGTHQRTSGEDDEGKKGALLRRLRQNAKYLTPGNGITALSLLGVLLRNGFVSVTVHGGLMVLVLLLLIGTGFLQAGGSAWPPVWPMTWAAWLCAGLFGVYAAMSAGYVVLTGFFDALFKDDTIYRMRRGYEEAVHWLLLTGAAFFVLAALPWLYTVTSHAGKLYTLYAGAVSTFFGAVAGVWAFLQSSGVEKPKVPLGLVVAIASLLLLLGVVVLAFAVALHLGGPDSVWNWAAWIFAMLIVVGWIPGVNYLSVHRYYRDRLMEAFMPDKDDINKPEAVSRKTRTGNEAMLGAVCGVDEAATAPDKRRGPYHLVCANAVLVSSGNPRYRGRGGDSFLFSPLFTGSNATGWEPTAPTPGAGMTLATAMAISGAAVNPAAGCGGEGVTRQPVLSVLMSMLNIRLGYWLANPRRLHAAAGAQPAAVSRLRAILFKPNMLLPGLWESFGRRNLREDADYLLLTDGGHFENLGLYELLRRRLKVIVVCDGAADPDYTFADLANALERARADFGALVDISSADLEDLVPRGGGGNGGGDGDDGQAEMPVAKRGYLVAPIRYASSGSASPDKGSEDCGLLIYITTTFFKELNASLHGYRRAHPAFPDEPTSDQFFDEKQFESYRELGFQTAWRMMNELSRDGGGDEVLLNGVAFHRIAREKECTTVPPPFQEIRERIRSQADGGLGRRLWKALR